MYSNMKYYENICNCLRVIQQDINRKLKSANCWQRTSLIENNHLIFHINDYKAHLSSLTSQFDKLISISLNICIKIAVFSQNYTATAAKFDE